MPSRRLDWPDCRNTRDLGGLPRAGGLTRPGLLVRSDNLRSLNAAGQEAMVAYGVTTVIDLRSESEVAKSPSPFASPEDGPAYVHLPLIDDATMLKLAEASDMFERYLMMLEHRSAAFGEIFSTLAKTEGTVVFHCFAGKDRTGMVAAMSLALAGVEVDAIAGDYAETDSQMATRYDEWLAAASPEQLEELRDDLRCPPQRIVRVLEHLDQRWGGVEGYMQASGMPAADIAALRSKLAG